MIKYTNIILTAFYVNILYMFYVQSNLFLNKNKIMFLNKIEDTVEIL